MSRRRCRLALGVAGIAIAIYLNALPNGFVYDDHALVRMNPALGDASRLGAFFRGDLWSGLGKDATNYYRPLPALVVAAVHGVAGETPWAYRLVNLLLHALASVLVLRLLFDLFDRDGGGADAARPRLESAAFAGAALFAVHPVHVEAVAWISGLMDVACGALALLAFDLYRRVDATPAGRARLAAGLLASLLAMLAKEPAAVLPGVLLLYELTRPAATRLGPRAALGRILPWLVPLALYLGLRSAALGGLAPQGRGRDLGVGEVLRLVGDLYARYVRVLFVPIDLSLGQAAAPPASGLSSRTVAALLAIALTAVFLAWSWRRARPAAFGAGLFVLTLAPALAVPALVMPLPKLFAERYLYLPSAGWAVALTAALALPASGRAKAARGWALLATALVVLFGLLTVRQNLVWRDEVSVWADAVAKFPHHGMNHLDYGNALLGAGDGAGARSAFERAAALDPGVVDLLVHQGRRNLEAGRPREAILKFEQALAVAPSSFDALLGSADAYNAAGWDDPATERYRAALARRPDSSAACNGLGFLLARQGRLDEAIAMFERAVAAAPDDPVPLRNLATASERNGDAARAAALRARAAQLAAR